MEKAEGLIDQLVQDLKPVRRLPRRRSSAVILMLGMIAAIAVVAPLTGLGPQAIQWTSSRVYDMNALLLIVIWWLATAFLHELRLPNPKQNRLTPLLSCVLGALAIFLLIENSYHAPAHTVSIAEMGWLCTVRVISLAAAPFALALAYLRRGAPTQFLKPAITAALSSLALAAVILQLFCSFDWSLHILFAHLVAPILTLGLLATAMGRLILKW